MYQKTLSLDDVLLEPQYSDITTRSSIHIGNNLNVCGGIPKKINLEAPIIASPMDTVTETALAKEMSRNGCFSILHRYNSIEEQVEMVKQLERSEAKYGAAIGVSGDYQERAKALFAAGCRVICVDVAHGHHENVAKAVKFLRDTFSYNIHIMAGNVANGKGFKFLADRGVDSIRVGIGSGAICSTQLNTGHGIPSFSTIQSCYNEAQTMRHPPKIIMDGGIKNAGDVVKALAAGADFIMAGSLFAGTNEAPGEIFYIDGKPRKTYRGMSSRASQLDWRNKSSAPEGISTTVPAKGALQIILEDLKGNIRSGFSYSGARNLDELRKKAKFVIRSPSAQREGDTHILFRN